MVICDWLTVICDWLSERMSKPVVAVILSAAKDLSCRQHEILRSE